MRRALLAAAIAAGLLFGCTPVLYLGSSGGDSDRIWISYGDEVYRCADGSAVGEPPRPVCVRAPKAEPR